MVVVNKVHKDARTIKESAYNWGLIIIHLLTNSIACSLTTNIYQFPKNNNNIKCQTTPHEGDQKEMSIEKGDMYKLKSFN